MFFLAITTMNENYLFIVAYLLSHSHDSASQNDANFSDATFEWLHSVSIKYMMSTSDAVDLESPLQHMLVNSLALLI